MAKSSAWGLKSGSKTLTTASTVYALGTGLAMSELYVMAGASNSGDTYIGGSNVSASTGILLSKTVPLKLPHVLAAGFGESYDLSGVFVVGAADGDTVKFFYANKFDVAV
jgi:hypothetical protein